MLGLWQFTVYLSGKGHCNDTLKSEYLSKFILIKYLT